MMLEDETKPASPPVRIEMREGWGKDKHNCNQNHDYTADQMRELLITIGNASNPKGDHRDGKDN
ncbi:MAG: hypothetical protein MZU97_04565 [Bacillus subtilis]|nr:hypothetical protein [Bacillus subtilis]